VPIPQVSPASAQDAGLTGFLQKPFKPGHLCDNLAAVLSVEAVA
jgi:hypothetical protein